MDTAKWVSSGTTYILRNGKNTVHMSPIELMECNYISYSVYIFYKCTGGVFVQLGNFLLFISESSRNGSKVRRGPFPFIPLATLEVEGPPSTGSPLCGTTE